MWGSGVRSGVGGEDGQCGQGQQGADQGDTTTIVETAMALDALGWGHHPAVAPGPEGPASEAIRLPPGRISL